MKVLKLLIAFLLILNTAAGATFQNDLFKLTAPDGWKIQKDFFGADVIDTVKE